ncbi:type II toxin-antitoxin system HipA family toxin [Arachidicoccus ginsenosidivorans]|nr:type II toxin-antitoxin system HipA family toxin [Arachidicoccus ginsenosidivorans]
MMKTSLSVKYDTGSIGSIGNLLWNTKNKQDAFTYNPLFVEQQIDLAPIQMSIQAPRTQQQLPWPAHDDKLYRSLPPMIADALPDYYGHALYKAWLNANKIYKSKHCPLDLLAFIGNSAIGALEFEPDDGLTEKKVSKPAMTIDLPALSLFSQKVLREKIVPSINKDNAHYWQQIMATSIFAGGRQPKAIIGIGEKIGQILSANGSLPEGYQPYLLKFEQDQNYPATKLEYIYYKIARLAGISIMDSRLLTIENSTHFLTKRFDRNGMEKIHTQTLAAMAPHVKSYEGIFEVMHQLKLPASDFKQQYLRMVFNVVMRNVDDHNKNFSFCMDKTHNWQLSPAYDQVFSLNLSAPHYTNRHSLTVCGKNEHITKNDLEKVALQNNIQHYKTLIDQVIDAASHFAAYAKELGLPEDLIRAIQSQHTLA